MFDISDSTLEGVWKNVADYEKEHFGQRFGPDFPTIAEILRRNERFMTLGVFLTMISSMEVNGIGQEFKHAKQEEKEAMAKTLLTKPMMSHNLLAEVFYVGYTLGKQVAEVRNLESLGAGGVTGESK